MLRVMLGSYKGYSTKNERLYNKYLKNQFIKLKALQFNSLSSLGIRLLNILPQKLRDMNNSRIVIDI